MSFHDHFSGHAMEYARARPRYPAALFDWLASQCESRKLAWDAGCGNGQAANELASRFTSVVGTDPSADQIAQASSFPNVEYRVELAESPSLETGSADLVVVAQAFHWFELERFHEAVRRTLRPGGVIAVWTYGLSRTDPAVDAVFTRLYHHMLGPYWPPERRHVENGYIELPFPYSPIEAPHFAMECKWTLDAYLAYLRTWSATQRYIKTNGSDPVEAMRGDFALAWGDRARIKNVRWPLALRVGRFQKGANVEAESGLAALNARALRNVFSS